MRLRSRLPRFAAFIALTVCGSIAFAQQQRPSSATAQNKTAAAGQQAPGAGVHQEGTDGIWVDASGVPIEDQSKGPALAAGAASPSDEGAVATSAPNVPGDTVSVPSKAGEVQQTKNGGYLIKSNVQEVVLHATVVDQHQRLVTDLQKNDFTVFEDGQPQQITRFSREDVPVSIGILIDNSGSMRDKRQAVNQAALDLVKASNPDDEVFVVNFSDEAIIDADLTNDLRKLQEGLEQVDSRGGTALYDAVVASADYLSRKGRREKKVLLVITDGEDNASTDTLEQAVRRVQDDNGPVIYTIGILGGEREKRARRALEALALQTGGVAFFPKDLTEVDQISKAVARDIRSQYNIFYRPIRPQEQGGYRQVKIDAHARGYNKLMVRTRSGYYANQQTRAQAAPPAAK